MKSSSTNPAENLAGSSTPLIWIDLEMTGLDTMRDAIIEIATIITDSELNEIAQGPVIAISHPESVFENMDDWNQTHHSRSGLIERCLASKDDMATAEQKTLGFLRQYLEIGESPMCGNSICQDRRFLARSMPELESFFHYRNLDVSTIGALCKKWYSGTVPPFKKERKHLALNDIQESIAELVYYRKNIFRAVDSANEQSS